MIKRIQFLKAALKEMNESYEWYEHQRKGLGEDFILCVEEAVEKAVRFPELYPIIYKTIRRAIVRRFPYSIFYFVRNNKMIIIAVFHSSRNPQNWKNRI